MTIGVGQRVFGIRKDLASLLVCDIETVFFKCLEERHFDIAVVLPGGTIDTLWRPRLQGLFDSYAGVAKLVRNTVADTYHLTGPRAFALVEVPVLRQFSRLTSGGTHQHQPGQNTHRQPFRAEQATSLDFLAISSRYPTTRSIRLASPTELGYTSHTFVLYYEIPDSAVQLNQEP